METSSKVTRWIARQREAREMTCQRCGDRFRAGYGSDRCPACEQEEKRLRERAAMGGGA